MKSEFTYRDLSEKLGINLTKLKRWGREFLEPDYSAGQQQGVARILSIDDAFLLFLGGHLVSHLKFSIPETKIILDVIIPWMRDKYLIPSLIQKKQNVAEWSLRLGCDTQKHIGVLEVTGRTRQKYKHLPGRTIENLKVSVLQSTTESVHEIVEPKNFFEKGIIQISWKTLDLSSVIDEFLRYLNAEDLRNNFLFDPAAVE